MRYFWLLIILLFSAPCFAGVLDDVSGATVAYGLRKLDDDYTGNAIRVRRASDDGESDIGFSGSDLDTSTLETYCSGTDCYVVTWYDQSGNTDNLTQATAANQPQIVSNGSTLVDWYGKPRLSFDASNDDLSGTIGSVSNQNTTIFILRQANYSTGEHYPLDLNNCLIHTVKETNGGMWKIHNGVGYSGDQATGDSTNAIWVTLPSIEVFDANGLIAKRYRGHRETDEEDNTGNSFTAQTSTDLSLGADGSYNGHLQEVIIYTHLSDANRKTVVESIAEYYDTGDAYSTQNSTGGLYQDSEWSVNLYDWMETLTENDFDAPAPTTLSWDETYADAAELSNIWLRFTTAKSDYLIEERTNIVRADKHWFVLDDGSGHGIEGSGSVKLYRGLTGNKGVLSPICAYFYSLDLPKNGGGQGNPYYQDSATALRGLATMAADLIMYDYLVDTTSRRDRTYYLGTLSGWAYTYNELRGEINSTVQGYFEDALMHFAKRVWGVGRPADAQSFGNMLMKTIGGIGTLYPLVESNDQAILLEAAKYMLFGSYTGTAAATNKNEGIYASPGYIVENSGPDTTYHGHSLFHLMEAHAYVRDDSDWSFLDEIIQDIAKLKTHQFFPDPDGYWAGPSGYANRTGDDVIRDQGAEVWRDLSFAATETLGRPFIVENKFNNDRLETEATMTSDVNSAVSYANSRNFGSVPDNTVCDDDSADPFCCTGVDTGTCDEPTAYSYDQSHLHWSPTPYYQPESGWYSSLKTLRDASDTSMDYPYNRSGTFSEIFSTEFWAYKNNDGSQDFGFFIETIADPGGWNGWYGGSVQAFWADDAGMLLLARHDKAGTASEKNENTRVWSEIDEWATHHIYGTDDTDSYFTTAPTDGETKTVEYGDNSVVETSIISSAYLGGQQDDDEITGTATFENKFEATTTGLQITHTITYSGSDTIKTLWCCLPVYLRDTDQSMSDTTIEYWDGDSWETLSTSLVSATKVRLGRDWGSGAEYGYIVFSSSQSVKLNGAVWVQSYQGNSRHRNILIDLHPNTGTATTFPASTELVMHIGTQDSFGEDITANTQGISIKGVSAE